MPAGCKWSGVRGNSVPSRESLFPLRKQRIMFPRTVFPRGYCSGGTRFTRGKHSGEHNSLGNIVRGNIKVGNIIHYDTGFEGDLYIMVQLINWGTRLRNGTPVTDKQGCKRVLGPPALYR